MTKGNIPTLAQLKHQVGVILLLFSSAILGTFLGWGFYLTCSAVWCIWLPARKKTDDPSILLCKGPHWFCNTIFSLFRFTVQHFCQHCHFSFAFWEEPPLTVPLDESHNGFCSSTIKSHLWSLVSSANKTHVIIPSGVPVHQLSPNYFSLKISQSWYTVISLKDLKYLEFSYLTENSTILNLHSSEFVPLWRN